MNRVEKHFDISFVAPLAMAEKQIQQAYRPYIQVHKWFARRPGSLFRSLLLAEFDGGKPLRESYTRGHDLRAVTVLDPFLGGGTPVVEANRIGMNVVGCDINPMAVWIVRQELTAVDPALLRECAEKVIDSVDADVAPFYRTQCQRCARTVPVKYFIWVKQLPCQDCGNVIELLPRHVIAAKGRHPRYVLRCPLCHGLFESDTRPEPSATLRCSLCKERFVNSPTAHRNRYACTACGRPGRYPRDVDGSGPPEHRLIALEYHCADCRPNHKGRFFKAPDDRDRTLFDDAREAFEQSGRSELIPRESIPEGDETTRLLRWGYRVYSEIFNKRQLLSLTALFKAISNVEDTPHRLALATMFSDLLRYQNMLCRYDTTALKCQDIFSVHGFPVGLFQCENNVIGTHRVGSGGMRHVLEKYLRAKTYCLAPFEKVKNQKVIIDGERIAATFSGTGTGKGKGKGKGRDKGAKGRSARLVCAPAASFHVAPNSVDAVITDPPYFDNVQYAELIDFCYVWLRRLVEGEGDGFDTATTGAPEELTGNKTRHRGLDDFCDNLSRSFCRASRALKPAGLFAFTYHHNTADAYLPIIVALLDARLVATACFPCPAEMAASLHIARTKSSVMDTIICARKPAATVVPFSCDQRGLAALLEKQSEQLSEGGVTVTEADLRCMGFGLSAVQTITELTKGWRPRASIEEKLSRVRDRFSTISNAAR